MEIPQEARPGQDRADLSDDELDAYILARLRLAGVDLDVLPEEDPDAPVDRARILRSARRFLRSTPPAIRDLVMDPQAVPPAMYPAAVGAALRGSGAEEGRGSGAGGVDTQGSGASGPGDGHASRGGEPGDGGRP